MRFFQPLLVLLLLLTVLTLLSAQKPGMELMQRVSTLQQQHEHIHEEFVFKKI